MGQKNSNTVANSRRMILKLTQSSTSAPVVTEVLNDFAASPASAYSSTGVYTLILADAFQAGRTSIKVSNNGAPQTGFVKIAITDDDTLTISTFDLAGPTAANGILVDCLIEIESQY